MKEETKLEEVIQQPGVQPAKAAKSGAAIRNLGLAGAGAAAGAVFLGLNTHLAKNDPEDEPSQTAEEPIAEETPVSPTTPAEQVQQVGETGYVINGELPIATCVTDDMRFGEAFAAARAEVGPGGYFQYHDGWYGTYYKEEWAEMNPAEKTQFSAAIYNHPDHEFYENDGIVIHDVAPIATWVQDDMPLSDAQLIARMELGAGGLFVHEGTVYSTYYPSELERMTPEQHQQFINSVARADISTDVQTTDLDVGDYALIEVDSDNLIYEPEEPIDEDVVTGELIEEGLIELEDGELVYGELIDTNGNGLVDAVRLTDIVTGEVVEMDIDEENGDIIDVRTDDSIPIDTSSYSDDLLADNAMDFDPNADMIDWA
ncbi:MAG: hypothetical protein LBU22_03290 [Dysgonamonadaceae bacterium]|jgi:hypothetical protein|nr:hypothetical protein [Dysgonamonadaceae bacterium]